MTSRNHQQLWWERRTGLEKCFTVVTSINVLIAIALVTVSVLFLTRNLPLRRDQAATIDPDTICLTPGCIQTASSVLKHMDPTVDPCENFYEFACGNFLKKMSIPADQAFIASYGPINDLVKEQLKTLVEEPIQEHEPHPFKLAKKFYKVCMNKTLIERNSLNTIASILIDLGGWPVLEGGFWREHDFSWKKSVFNFRKVGYRIDFFIVLSLGPDLKNSTDLMINVDQPSLGLPRQFLIKGRENEIVKAYYEYMVDVALLLRAPTDRVRTELSDVLNFEIKLANITLPLEKLRDVATLYNPIAFDDLLDQFPDVPWFEYLKTLLTSESRVSNDELINVRVPQYLRDLKDLIDATPKRVQANYILWRVVSHSILFLNDRLRKRKHVVTTLITGRIAEVPRWKECVDVTTEGLGHALGALYVRKYFDEEARQNALEMVNNIRAEFDDVLQNIDWMDEDTKRNALDKAKSMSTHIAYPVELLDDDKLINFYGYLDVNPSNYLKSMINIWRFENRFWSNRFGQPFNKTDWITHSFPTLVNAFYMAHENSIYLPAGILQGVFFDADRPRYMNYGAIGYIIGHEITHGFDDQGRKFDKDGNVVDWWQAKTGRAFLKKAQCIIDQYSNYTVPELGTKVNGKNTQGENIADNGGIKLAYLAYTKWTDLRGSPEQALPGVNLTPKQMFWVSAANAWCAKYRPEIFQLKVANDLHSPEPYRVNGPFSNMESFAEDFDCPIDSKMNPEKKCKIW